MSRYQAPLTQSYATSLGEMLIAASGQETRAPDRKDSAAQRHQPAVQDPVSKRRLGWIRKAGDRPEAAAHRGEGRIDSARMHAPGAMEISFESVWSMAARDARLAVTQDGAKTFFAEAVLGYPNLGFGQGGDLRNQRPGPDMCQVCVKKAIRKPVEICAASRFSDARGEPFSKRRPLVLRRCATNGVFFQERIEARRREKPIQTLVTRGAGPDIVPGRPVRSREIAPDALGLVLGWAG